MKNIKKVIAVILTVMLVMTALPFSFGITASAATIGGLDSLSCASFISNTTAQKYIDKMMKYYINNYSYLQTTLTSGQSVVFMFEGGSDNFTGGNSNYELVVGDTRNQAVCIVVELNSSGNAYIPFFSENCSSVPDNPTNCTNGVAYSGSTTVKDGIYSFYTWNHTGPYAAFQLNLGQGYYTPTANLNGYTAGASGLNIHTRSTNTCNGVSWSWSAGCQVIGSGAYSDNVFNSFMKTVANISWNPWIDYYNKSFNTFASTGTTKGYYVLDRQLGKYSASGTKYGSGSLIALYNQTALDNITAFSTTASANAPDIEEIDYTTYYYPACPSDSETMYATMNSMGIVGNYANLKKIALANGYAENTYSGTAEQNTAILNHWKQGLLKNPDATGSPAYPYAAESATILSDAIGSFGFDNSANTLARIKIANKTIKEADLLALMKKGELLQPTGNATVYEAENNSLITTTADFSVFASGGASNTSVLYTARGGTAALTFTGTKLDLYTTFGPRLKSMHISLDGGEFKRVEPGATSTSYFNKLYSTGDIADGTHTLVIKCEGQAHIDVFEVFDGTLVENTAALDQTVTVDASDNTKIQKNGGWKVLNGLSYDNSKALYTTSGGKATFSFYGSQFKINTFPRANLNKLFVSVDGGAETEIALSTDTSLGRSVAYDSGILKSGIHNVTLRAEGAALIDSIDIFGEALNTFACAECGGFLDDVSLICKNDQKSISDMMSTYQDETADFNVVSSSSLTGGTSGVDAKDAYIYSPTTGTERKNGFAIKQPIKGDFYGNESEWTIDAWVYISDISSYYMIMQFIPQSGLSMYSVKDSTKFNNYTENWAYRLIFTNAETGTGKMTLNAGWNHVQVPLSSVLLGSVNGNDHNQAAYTHLNDMGGVIDGITFHENTAANYGTYDFAVASVNLVKSHTCEYVYSYDAGEVEDHLDDLIISNNWVHRYNKNFSNKYALHTTKGGKIQFSFEGDQFSIVSYKSPSQGEIYVSIDGGKEFLAADLYDEVADTHFKTTVYTSDVLDPGTHTVTIRSVGKTVIDALPVNGDIVKCTTPIHDDVTIEIENMLNATFTGNWTKKYAWKLSAHNAMFNSDGGSVTFDFEGDEFSLVSYKANTQGKIYISIDGSAETEVNLYDESINTLYQQVVYTNKNLSYKEHTVTIRAEGNVSLDSIIINRESAETVNTEAEDIIAESSDWKKVYAWKLSNHYGLQTTTGASVTLTYYGYDVKVISYKAKTQGKMFITIDDGE
ncbi:MAG: hypothetical protein IJ462_01180 [Clostridia bacterium]|nr:hypothetical protein [Clostridia bacterium]